MDSTCLGSATISPEGSFPAGSTGTWTITYTVGTYGIDDGGSIIIVRRAMSDAVMTQCEYPTADGFISAETNGEASIKVLYDNRYWIRPWRGAIVVKVFDGSLAEGDTVTIVIGDTSKGSPGWSIQTFPETCHRFKVLVDAFGTREYYEIEKHPGFRIVCGEATKIEAIVPTFAKQGAPVSVVIRIIDKWDNPLDEYTGVVNISVPELDSIPDMKVNMEKGVADIGTVSFDREGVFRIQVNAGELEGFSNAIVIREKAPTLFWADMHGQTEQTVGTGSVEEYFAFAKDKGIMDVTAWQGNDFQVTDETWAEVCRQTKAFHEPGKFVTFLGYEWSGLTPAGGDHNILYRGDDQPIHRSSHWQIHDGGDENSDRYPLSALFESFKGRNDMMAIAHVGGRYGNFDYWDDDFSGLVEIHSHHGTFEWFALDALKRGKIIGIVGQSDDHTCRPGLSAPLRALARDFATFDVYGGYTGIYADSLDRESIWNALRTRHCYATTGKRIMLDVRTGEKIMGDIVEDAENVSLDISTAGTAPLLDVLILNGTDIVYRQPFDLAPDDTWVRVEWSGVRVKSRAKTADWDGIIEVSDGTIEDFRPYAFDQPTQGIERIDEKSLKVISTTSGDIDGVFLKIAGNATTLKCENVTGSCKISLKSLTAEPLEKDFGGVNLAMRFSLSSPFNRPENLSFPYQHERELTKPGAFWVKVVQIDGHMAWSSPIYFK